MKSNRAIIIIKIKSGRNVIQFRFIGFIIEVNPITDKILNKFEPIILPIAMSVSFLIAANTEAASYGRLVPKATIVTPMTL